MLETGTSSKKRALEMLSERLATATHQLTATEIFDRLNARERLGSTGLGHGVAIPHSRTPGIDDAVGAILKLKNGVDFDALDKQPVDFFFALLVPEESREEHLELLSQLAELFSDKTALARIRSTEHADELLNLFRDQATSHAA